MSDRELCFKIVNAVGTAIGVVLIVWAFLVWVMLI